MLKRGGGNFVSSMRHKNKNEVSMRKIVLLLIVIILFKVIIFAQIFVKNPEKPFNKNAGRVVKLKEISRIRDSAPEIIFKAPYDLKVGQVGNVYFCDNFNLYRFDDEGKFVFKIIREGQGPGEATGKTTYLLMNDEIIVLSESPPKIMRFDLKGNYKSEKRFELMHGFKFIGMIKDKVYGFSGDVPSDGYAKEGFIDFPTNLYEISNNFDNINKVYSFPINYYVYKGFAWWPRATLDYAKMDGKYLFVTHTASYQIIKYDIEKRRIENIFKRKYRRVKIKKQYTNKPKAGGISAPPLKFYEDISKLLIHKDELWVFTSTKDKKNRRLIDVYNLEGKYTDNFYLEYPEKISPRNFAYDSILLVGEYIYSIDEHADGDLSIGRYKILY